LPSIRQITLGLSYGILQGMKIWALANNQTLFGGQFLEKFLPSGRQLLACQVELFLFIWYATERLSAIRFIRLQKSLGATVTSCN
jgi:hypothetical protein